MKPAKLWFVVIVSSFVASALVGCKTSSDQQSPAPSAVANTSQKPLTSEAPIAVPQPPSVEQTTLIALIANQQRTNDPGSIGQRYHFRACVTHDLSLFTSTDKFTGGCDPGSDHLTILYVADFDNEREHELLLSEPEGMRTVTATYEKDFKLHIHGVQ